MSRILGDFDIAAPVCTEDENGGPADTALNNARRKAYSLGGKDAVIIACDTVVAYEGLILGKPADLADAERMLKLLRNEWHEVFSGVCVLADKEYAFFERSRVKLKPLTDGQIKQYVEAFRPYDKAGAYGIQDGVAAEYEGDYDNIVGLPLTKLKSILKENGADVKE